MPMRTICYNIYMCRGWPQEVASRQSASIVMQDLLAKALVKCKPDVITFSEAPSDSIKADQPDQRIDYIFVYGPILQRLCECRVLSEVPFQPDPSVSKPWCLSDHLPVMATFSLPLEHRRQKCLSQQ